MRLFFDLVSEQSECYDFSGRDFGQPEEAVRVAEEIAADLGASEIDNSIGSQVQVRNAAGKTLFAVPVSLAV